MLKLSSLISLLVLGLSLGIAAAPPTQNGTVTGELLDVSCHMKSIKAGQPAGATSVNHSECALLCAQKGISVGVQASDGLYWVVGDLTKQDNKSLLAFVNRQVKASGAVATVDGRKTIDVRNIELADAAGR